MESGLKKSQYGNPGLDRIFSGIFMQNNDILKIIFFFFFFFGAGPKLLAVADEKLLIKFHWP